MEALTMRKKNKMFRQDFRRRSIENRLLIGVYYMPASGFDALEVIEISAAMLSCALLYLGAILLWF